LEVDLAGANVLTAPFAGEVGAHAAAAAGVKCESWRAARGGVVAVAPLDQDDEGGAQLAALVGEDVLRSAGAMLVRQALEHAFVTEELEPIGEDVGRDSELVLEVLEALDAEERIAEDQQRPPLADHFQRPSDRADLVGIFALEHT
jgi:hypothetical protein